jgi:hypothetical protein
MVKSYGRVVSSSGPNRKPRENDWQINVGECEFTKGFVKEQVANLYQGEVNEG